MQQSIKSEGECKEGYPVAHEFRLGWRAWWFSEASYRKNADAASDQMHWIAKRCH